MQCSYAPFSAVSVKLDHGGHAEKITVHTIFFGLIRAFLPREWIRMSENSPMELQEDLDDAKALDLLCGTDAERSRACAYYYEKYSVQVMNAVRAKYLSLHQDLIAEAVNQAFETFFDKAASDPAFDQDHPERFMIAIALNKACDKLRKKTKRGKFKEELVDDIASILEGTATSRAWSVAVQGGSARELQDIFRKELESFGERQRKVARLLVNVLERPIDDAELAELYRTTYNETVTVPAVKSARTQVRIKFRELLERVTRQKS
jgi:DNA-directed RNA polymerase specialized sigma24 family protein